MTSANGFSSIVSSQAPITTSTNQLTTSQSDSELAVASSTPVSLIQSSASTEMPSQVTPFTSAPSNQVTSLVSEQFKTICEDMTSYSLIYCILYWARRSFSGNQWVARSIFIFIVKCLFGINRFIKKVCFSTKPIKNNDESRDVSQQQKNFAYFYYIVLGNAVYKGRDLKTFSERVPVFSLCRLFDSFTPR